MKKILSKISIVSFLALIMLLVTTFAIPCTPAQGIVGPPPLIANPQECWGVFVGVGEYEHGWGNPLNRADAEDLYNIISPVWGASHMQLLEDSQATKSDVLDSVDWLANQADSNDTVLFFISALGDVDSILCYDTWGSAGQINPTELANAFDSVNAGKIVIILQVWGSGAFQTALSENGRVVIMSSGVGESAWIPSELEHSVFGGYVIQAFQNFEATDTNHDYRLSAEEVFESAGPATTQYEVSNSYPDIQHPLIDDGYTGDLPLIDKFVFENNVTLPAGATAVTIDGTNYTSEPQTRIWAPGSSHTITVPELVSAGTGTRYVFTGWEGGGTSSTIYTSYGSYTADYNKEYQLTLTSPYNTPTGDGWYVDGTSASFSITASLETSDTKRFFTGWSGDFTGTAASGSIVMNAPKSITANWRTEFLLTINSVYGAPTGAGWYDEGDSANISVEEVQGFIIRQIFDGWTGDLTSTAASTSVTMNAPKVITATWHTDYLQLYILIGIVVVVVAGIIITIVLVRRKGTTPRPPAAAPPTYSPPPPTAAPPPPPAR